MKAITALHKGQFRIRQTCSAILVMLLSIAALLSFHSSLNAQNAPYRVVATVDYPVPYVGQQVVYTFKFYAETLPAYDYAAPSFTGWWRGEQLTSSGVEMVDGVQYQVVTIETLIYPLSAGAITVEPAKLVIPATVFADRIELMTQPVTLDVQPLPPGAPTEFNGAVGRFSTEVTVDKQTVTLGEPVVLRYRINGAGNLAQLAPPKLQLPDGNQWRTYANPSTTNMQTRGFGERIFEWRLIPERAGSQNFPAMVFSYFDPEQSSYQTVESEPFTIEVLPTADGQRELPTFRRSDSAGRPAALPIKPIDEFENPSGQSGGLSLFFWFLPPAGVLLVWSGREWLARRRLHLAYLRQTRALQTAKNRLQGARKLPGEKAYQQIYEAIGRYFADKLNAECLTLPSNEILTLPEREKAIDSRGDEIKQVLECLQLAEDGRYAPPGVIAVDSLAVRTVDALTTLDKVWWT